MIPLLVPVLILFWIPLSCADLAMNMNQYKAVRMTPGGPAVCAFDNPTATHIGLIMSLCSTKCSRNDNCLYYNYHIPPNQQLVCQLFDFHPQSVGAMDNCVLFVVSHTRLLHSVRRRSRRTFSTHYKISRLRVDGVVIYFFNSNFKFLTTRRNFQSVLSMLFLFFLVNFSSVFYREYMAAVN